MTDDHSAEGFGLSDPEPEPNKNLNKFVWDEVIEELLSRNSGGDKETRDLISRDMRQRDQFGFRKYGTRLQSGNGRNSFIDAYQELLDYIVYLKQCEIEGDKHQYLYETAIVMITMMKKEIEKRNTTKKSSNYDKISNTKLER